MLSTMYLRPGNLFKEFAVERSDIRLAPNGRSVQTYSFDPPTSLKGCLAEARNSEVARFGQLGHPITHTVVQYGRRKAKEDDRLHLSDGRTFLVQGVDEAGSLGVCTIYYVNERNDVK